MDHALKPTEFRLPGLPLIDWPIIVNRLSSLAHFESSKRSLEESIPRLSHFGLSTLYDALDFVISRPAGETEALQSTLRALPEQAHAYNFLRLLEKHATPALEQLNHAALLMEGYLKIPSVYMELTFFNNVRLEPEVTKSFRRRYLSRFRVIVSPDGEIHIHNHPVLSKLDGELKQVEKKIRTTLEHIKRLPLYKEHLQNDGHDLINDRYVLSIRSDRYSHKMGSILGRSSSGLTLYVAPPQLKVLDHKKLILLAQIDEAINQICQEYSQILASFGPSLHTALKCFQTLDKLLAKASYSNQPGYTRPEVVDDENLLFEDLFHPLIENPIKNDVTLSQEHKGLVLSGPNTGGKTVFLKSLCLACLHLHLGVYLPARRARLPVYDGLFFFSHDQQDILQGLSSFASETKNYLTLLDELEAKNLVFVDEIFNSTSSEEASALAIAFLEEVHARAKTTFFISTHHQLFKTFIHTKSDYISAHVNHDPKSMKPTYKVSLGEPGSSMALMIFNNLSIQLKSPNSIDKRAKNILGHSHISYERLLADLSEKQQELERSLEENRELSTQLKNQKKSMQGVLKLQKEQLFNDYEGKITALLKKSKSLLDNIKGQNFENKKRVRAEWQSLKDDLEEEKQSLLPQKHTEPKRLRASVDELTVGQEYFIQALGKNMQLLSLNRSRGQAVVGGKFKKIKVPLKDFFYLDKQAGPPPPSEFSLNVDVDQAPLEFDARGMRLEPFQEEIYSHLASLKGGQTPFLNVIHGHGNGVLKSWLREYLRSCGEYEWNADQGNDGSTYIKLRP